MTRLMQWIRDNPALIVVLCIIPFIAPMIHTPWLVAIAGFSLAWVSTVIDHRIQSEREQ